MRRGSERVLIVEFINADQRPGRVSATLPFAAGDFAMRGVPARWLRFAVATTNLFENGCDHVTLSRAESRRLREAAAELRPTLIGCTDRLSPADKRALRRASPGARIDEAFCPPGGELLPLLDRPGFAPRYDWEAGNAAAERPELDNIYLHLVEDCGYRRCTFCSACTQEPPTGRTPARWVARQLDAIAAERRAAGRTPNAVLLGCLPGPEVLDLCLAALERDGLSGARLLLALRANKVVEVAALLRRRFESRPGPGPRVGVYSCGIESFHADDLRLYRKGTRPLDGLRAVNELRALASDFPERFSYEGLSFLLFTPWTTLEGLELNYGVMRALALVETGNNRFQCRLRLHPSLPLTALAREQGLLAAAEADPVVVMNRRKLFSAELPWVFRDPRIRPLSRLVLRYDLLDSPLADELAGELLAGIRRAVPGWKRGDDLVLLDLTLEAIAAARESASPLEERALLGRAVERLLARRAADPAGLRQRPLPSAPSWRAPERAELARGAAWAALHRAAPGGQGVLLVEFAALGRFTLGIEFPFIHAWLRARGIPVTWVRFALDAEARFSSREEGMSLPEEDARALLERVRAARPSRVLFSFQPADSLWERVRAEHPDARARYLRSEGLPRPERGAVAPVEASDAALRAWLGVPGEGERASYMSEEPHFGFIAGNEAARKMAPLAFLVAGEECVYRKSVASNPAYEGVDLSGCRVEGCAFCVSGGKAPGPRVSAVEEALRQLQAFYRTYPFQEGGPRPRLRLTGQKLLLEVERVASAVAELSAPPSDLLFDGRIDYLLRLEGKLEAAARRLAGSGHKAHVCLVGLENFSAPELLRMNKGITAAGSLAAIRMLRRLEREHPGSFGFEEHGGLSTILFSPWTTLEDLALNFSLVRHFGLERLCGKLLTSRVRLYEGLAMTALARRDGLLIDRYDDEALDTARRNFYPDELPWRFQHPEVEPISRIATRMQPSSALEGDPLYARVRRWADERRASGVPEAEAVLGLVRLALERGGPAEPEELLAPAPARAPARTRPAAPAPAAKPHDQLPAMLAVQRAGLARASRLEGLERAVAERSAAWLQEKGSAFELLERKGSWEVFFGPRASDVREAARLTEVQYSALPPAELAQAKARIGELYGYPSCCARSFAGYSCASPYLNEWLLLLRRCERPGPVDPLFNPFTSAVHYVPCSTSCKPSLARARAALSAVPSKGKADPSEARAHPVLFLLDRIGEFVELVPRGPVGRTFDFTAGSRSGSDPALSALSKGGTISISEGLITVRRRGARAACLAMRAAVWWHQEAFDAEFWRECAAAVLQTGASPAAPAAAAPRPAPAAASSASPSAALAERVRAALSGAALAGFAVAGVEPGPGRYVAVRLERPEPKESLVVHVELREGAQRFYKAAGDLAFGYSDATPLRTAAQAQAFAALMARLARQAGGVRA